MKTDDILTSSANKISLKKSLNTFMGNHKNDATKVLEEFRDEFLHTIQLVNRSIGKNAFKNFTQNGFSKKFHPAIFDAIMVSLFLIDKRGYDVCTISEKKHQELLTNEQFKCAVSKQTTNIKNIKKRIQLTGEILFGVDINEE